MRSCSPRADTSRQRRPKSLDDNQMGSIGMMTVDCSEEQRVSGAGRSMPVSPSRSGLLDDGRGCMFVVASSPATLTPVPCRAHTALAPSFGISISSIFRPRRLPGDSTQNEHQQPTIPHHSPTTRCPPCSVSQPNKSTHSAQHGPQARTRRRQYRRIQHDLDTDQETRCPHGTSPASFTAVFAHFPLISPVSTTDCM